jgi:hypothetical protein
MPNCDRAIADGFVAGLLGPEVGEDFGTQSLPLAAPMMGRWMNSASTFSAEGRK